MRKQEQCGCAIVIFGGNGDLSMRKLLPALYQLQNHHLLDNIDRIIGLGRIDYDGDDYRQHVNKSLLQYLPTGAWCEKVWRLFSHKLDYQQLDADTPEHYQLLANTLRVSAAQEITFYLATSPSLYGNICQQLATAELAKDNRVVLEKPLGHNLQTCRDINNQVASVFPEANTFRIDHYLGKETVQNLLALRFGNTMYQAIWNNRYIDNVQITVAECIGVEGRGSYYAQTGALRDMVQNHLLQVLSLVAMEPPATLAPKAVRDEKVKVLSSLGSIDVNQAASTTVRGQYRDGASEGRAVPGFLDEAGYEESTDTETFVAIKAQINNWRWANVPFYLRTGKRLSKRYSEIIIEFKKQPYSLFANDPNELSNKLIIQLQPQESIKVQVVNKKPGLTPQLKLKPSLLQLTDDDHEPSRQYDAYERLLLDAISGEQTLFMRRDEVETAWVWTDTIIDAWHQLAMKPKPYVAGSMGPAAAEALIERDGRSWYEPV